MRRGPAILLLITLLAVFGYGAQWVLAEGWARVSGFSPPHFAAARPVTGPTPLTSRLVLILIDDLRPSEALRLPSLDWLRRQGSSYRLTVPPPAYKAPVAATLLTGADPVRHGVLLPAPQHPLLADNLPAAVRRAKLAVGGTGSRALGTLLSTAVPNWETATSDAALLAPAQGLLTSAGPNLVLIQVETLHRASDRPVSSTEQDEAYLELLGALDGQLVRMLERIDLKAETVMVVGTLPIPGPGAAGSGNALPLIIAGAGIKPGHRGDASAVDVAPTAAALLGVATPLQNQGQPLLAILTTEGRGVDVIAQRYLSARKALSDAILLSLGHLSPAADPPQSADGAEAYLAQLADQEREAGFARWKEQLPQRLPYLGGGLALLLLYLFVVYRQPFGGALFAGSLTYAICFQLFFYLMGGRYSAAISGLDALSREVVAGLGLAGAAAMSIAAPLTGHLLARKGFRKRPYLMTASLHMTLSTAVLITLPVVALVSFTGWEFAVQLPQPGLLIWFFTTALQVVIIGFMGLIWAGLATASARFSLRLWPLKEIGDPERNADKVVRLRSLKRTGAKRRA